MSKPIALLRYANSRTLTLIIGIAALIATPSSTPVMASMIVGTADGNDKFDDVLAVVENFNTTNEPDLPTGFALFKKTDDDAVFVFNADNGFSFFDAPSDGNSIMTAEELHGVSTAWFEYNGPEPLLYYSVKSGTDFTVYTFWPGERNILTLDESNKNISHGTFWVPEPSALGLSIIAVWCLATAIRRSRFS